MDTASCCTLCYFPIDPKQHRRELATVQRLLTQIPLWSGEGPTHSISFAREG